MKDVIEEGNVTEFDANRGVASVCLPTGSMPFPSGAFLSGRPARLPEVGDRVQVRMRDEGSRRVVVVARLVKPR